MLLLLTTTSALAGSATWNLNATSGDFNWGTETNWTPATVPNGPADTATFDVSNTTDVFPTSGDDREVNGIVFNAGASSFTFTVDSFISFNLFLTISGQGITNNSGVTQNFVVREDFGGGGNGVIRFTNSATAGDLTVFTANPRPVEFGSSGEIAFFDTSTAGSATLIANDNKYASFPGGLITLADDSNGGTARVEVFGSVNKGGFPGGTLDISAHNALGVTIGSIEGTGTIALGANNLTVGSNNLSTTFAGVIQDGGPFGGDGPGSLTKIGTGTLILTNANTYTGGTTIARGGILANTTTTGSSTGTGAVNVNAGTLGGSGIIAGPVTVGTNTHTPASLAPSKGAKKPATLTIQSLLTLNDDSTYIYKLDTNRAVSDEVIANGVTIDSGAKFSFRPRGNNGLTLGQVFTVINNTAGTPIVGIFNNLSDGAIITVSGDNLQASYTGGDGNDLTLTVVP